MIRPVVHHQLRGGLGNQLFGWAATYALASRLGGTVDLTVRPLTSWPTTVDSRPFELEKFGISARRNGMQFKIGDIRFTIDNPSVRKKKLPTFIESRVSAFDPLFNNISYSCELAGYFQSHHYFEGFELEIRDFLRAPLHKMFDGENGRSVRPSEFISVHFRRGDYERNKENYLLLDQNYYSRAVQVARDEVGDLPIIVVADDLRLARAAFPEADAHFGASRKHSALWALSTLSAGKAIISANSTLSWWSAYLAGDSATRIFPTHWFPPGSKLPRPSLPEEWHQIG